MSSGMLDDGHAVAWVRLGDWRLSLLRFHDHAICGQSSGHRRPVVAVLHIQCSYDYVQSAAVVACYCALECAGPLAGCLCTAAKGWCVWMLDQSIRGRV
jgi:hypothetical protein